jgi:predicted lysophospholipase L1 biosynthesis ABC-type transport system permease subunit
LVGEEGLKDAAAKVGRLAGMVLTLVGQLRGAIGADVVLLAAAGLLALVAVVQLELRQRLPAVGRLAHVGRMR